VIGPHHPQGDLAALVTIYRKGGRKVNGQGVGLAMAAGFFYNTARREVAMIRTAWVWSVGVFLTLVAGGLLIFFSFFDRSGRSLHFFARLWARGILAAAGVTVHAAGIENVLGDGSKILVSNHQGYFDIFALFAEVPLSFGWVAKKELYRIPVFSLAMKRFGNVLIDRSNREEARRSLEAAAEQIRRGQSILIFAEGTRSPDGSVQAFKKGCYYLAKASGAPVVPISISGSYRVMPKGSFRPKPGTIHLVIGRPMHYGEAASGGSNGFLEHLRQTIITNQVPAP
jgi:1-acyl-sn-glycerol-3-phosphate acyltransferase